MPHNVSSPCIAISTAFDARAWGAGIQLFTRDGITTTGSASFAVVHDDILAALNGHGMASGICAELNAQYGGADWSCGIDENDRVYIEHATTDWEVLAEYFAGTNARWPYPAAGTGLAGGVAPFRHTGTGDWARGQTDNGNALLSVRKGGTTKHAPRERGRLASIPVALRTRGAVGDADDRGVDTLEDLENAAVGGGAYDKTHFGVTEDGHVWWEVFYSTYPTGTPVATTPTWHAADLRDALGFSGNEVVTNVESYRYRLVADNPIPGFMLPERPLTRLDRGTEQGGSAAALIGGGSYHVETHDYATAEIDFILGGPADAVDETCQWRRDMVPRLHDGAPVTVYQDWPETRRNGVGCMDDTYDTLRTVEHDGYRGRLLLWMQGNAASMMRWAGALRSRSSVALRMRERER